MVWSCSHSALDVPAFLPRSVAISPVGTVLFEFFTHSVWTVWDIANNLSTLA